MKTNKYFTLIIVSEIISYNISGKAQEKTDKDYFVYISLRDENAFAVYKIKAAGEIFRLYNFHISKRPSWILNEEF